MPNKRDNEVDFESERMKRRKPAPIAGRLFARFGNIRIGKPNRRVEVRQFTPRVGPNRRPAA